MANNQITVSINPTYFCNFACDFCYLTPEQLNDRTRLDLATLRNRLNEISEVFDICAVDLYGGEIGLLPKTYVQELKAVLYSCDISEINIITNLSMVNSTILDKDFYISVSYDFAAREQHEHVFNNMLMFPNPFSILMLASPTLIEQDVDEIIHSFNLLKNLQSVEIKPYSSNQANHLDITYAQYEDFIKRWLTSPIQKNFICVNDTTIKQSLFKERNSYSDDHIYLTPTGKLAVLEFDLNENEYFAEVDSIQDYIKWTESEKLRVNKNAFCSQCEYNGSCLSEHLKDVKNLDQSCNGFKHLIDWYKDTMVDSTAEWKMRQQLYHDVTDDYTDDLRKFTVVIEEDIVAGAVKYFHTTDVGWIYPAKSYVVGICYAVWLNKIYGTPVYELLNDPELLFGNDPYFVPYSQDPTTYDAIIAAVTLDFDDQVGVIPDIKEYFDSEMYTAVPPMKAQ